MKSQLTQKVKPVVTWQDACLLLVACLGFMTVFAFFSTELVEIVQQIEMPEAGHDELLTAVPPAQ